MRAALALALLLVACGSSQQQPATGGTTTGPTKPLQTKAEMDSCTADSDCALVDACCGCSAGGRKIGIRTDAVTDYEATRTQRCSSEVCPQVMSTHLSCDAEATCGHNGRCRATPHMQHQ